MKKPQVSLENETAVYDYFTDKEPSSRLMRPLHRLAAGVYRPDTVFAKGAEEAIARHIDSGRPIVMAANHLSMHDPLVLASMVQREKAFRPLIGRTLILSKPSLFNVPLVGRIVSNGGAIPVFRPEDIKSAEADEAVRRRETSAKAIGIAVAKLEQGFSIVLFPEGTRNKEDETRIQSLRPGIGRIACSASNRKNVLVVCTATAYGSEDKPSVFSPTIAVGYPLDVAREPEGMVEVVGESLQECLDAALDRAA